MGDLSGKLSKSKLTVSFLKPWWQSLDHPHCIDILHYGVKAQPAPCGWTLEADVRLTVSPPHPISMPSSSFILPTLFFSLHHCNFYFSPHSHTSSLTIHNILTLLLLRVIIESNKYSFSKHCTVHIVQFTELSFTKDIPWYDNCHDKLIAVSSVNSRLDRRWIWIYLLPGFNTLVSKVREGRAGNEATHAGGDMQIPIFQNNLPLANHHLWGSTQLHALKDIVLSSLKHR